MASKTIIDTPELLNETLVTLRQACREFPIPISRPASERYVRHGSRGVILESILICGKRYTSREAIQRFIRNQLQVEPPPARSEPTKTMPKKELAEKSRKFKLPEPQGKDE